MLYRKEGLPEEGELVLCTITKVRHHSVFANLDEYIKTGMIHISEVSPGRIRNIRDYVQEGKKVICKVLRIDKKKGHIDLSLRRVNEMQKRKKSQEIKQEQKAEKIIESVAKQLDKDLEKTYEHISKKAFENYEYIFKCFKDVVDKNIDLEKLGIKKKLASKLTKLIKKKIKPTEVSIRGVLELTSHDSDGLDIIKKALTKITKPDKDKIDVNYAGAGKYNVIVRAKNYKKAEKILDKGLKSAVEYVEDKEGTANFERVDK